MQRNTISMTMALNKYWFYTWKEQGKFESEMGIKKCLGTED